MLSRFLFLLALLLPVAADGAPQRIVSLAPSVTELLFALDCGERVAARTEASTYPPEARSFPSVGTYDRPSAERALAVRPDLCLGVADGTPPAFAGKMGEAGVSVSLLEMDDIASLPGCLRELGRMLDVPEKAEALASQAERRLAEAERAVAGARAAGMAAPSVLILVQEAPPMAAAEQTFLGSLVSRAGGSCAVQAHGRLRYPVLGREAMAALAPDIVLSCAMRGGPDAPAMQEADAAGIFPDLAGARLWRVSPDIFTRPSLRALDALDMLVRIFCGTGGPQ